MRRQLIQFPPVFRGKLIIVPRVERSRVAVQGVHVARQHHFVQVQALLQTNSPLVQQAEKPARSARPQHLGPDLGVVGDEVEGADACLASQLQQQEAWAIARPSAFPYFRDYGAKAGSADAFLKKYHAEQHVPSSVTY